MTERKKPKERARRVPAPATHSLLDKTIIDIFGISDTERNILITYFENSTFSVMDFSDFIIVPIQEYLPLKVEIGASFLKREMPLFAGFASTAKNEFDEKIVMGYC